MVAIGELMLLWDIRDEIKRTNDLVEEERVKKEWEKWDKEYNEKSVRRLRTHEKDLSFLTFCLSIRRKSTTPDSKRTSKTK